MIETENYVWQTVQTNESQNRGEEDELVCNLLYIICVKVLHGELYQPYEALA